MMRKITSWLFVNNRRAIMATEQTPDPPTGRALVLFKPDQELRERIAATSIDLKVIRTLLKAGFGTVTPRIDVKTFRLWSKEGFRPIAGTRSLRVGSLRLFHRSQVKALTADEVKALEEQQEAAIKRHEEAESNVVQLNLNLKDA
jgi:hypothetical protein